MFNFIFGCLVGIIITNVGAERSVQIIDKEVSSTYKVITEQIDTLNDKYR